MPSKTQQIARNYDDPGWWRDVAIPHLSRRGGKYLCRFLGPVVLEPYYYLQGGRCDFPGEDWDVAIILDACRYDLFAERHDLPGELDHRISKGGTTGDFLLSNFEGGTFYDTVYVTANPHVSHLLAGQFHEIVPVWDYGWDDQLKTVTPDVMASETLKAAREYPDKRIVAHFMQPHQPYIGETREQLGDHSGNLSARQTALEKLSTEFDEESAERIIREVDPEQGVDHTEGVPHIFPLVNAGLIDVETVRQAYVENLDIVLEEVSGLLERLDGRVVVTADHGELLQDRPIPFVPFFRNNGHFSCPYPPGLVKVPWLVHESGERREVSADPPRSRTGDESEIEEKLYHLGYVDR